MDLEKVQKINALASELQKHHFASSSQDAVQQAEEVLNEKHEEVPVETSFVKPAPAEADPLIVKKMELLLETNNKKHAQELELLRSAVNRLAHELESVKSRVSNIAAQAPPKPKEKQKELKTETKEPHPRRGDFNPDDVDIGQVFYFGNKANK